MPGADPITIYYMLAKLAPPVLELVSEIVEAVSTAKTKRNAARRIIILAAKKSLTG